jgi:hypothetical protein
VADLGTGVTYAPRTPIAGLTDNVYYTMPKQGIYLGLGWWPFLVVQGPAGATGSSVYYTLRGIPAGARLGQGTIPAFRVEPTVGPNSVYYGPRITNLGTGRRSLKTPVYLSAARPGSVFYTNTMTRAFLWNGTRWVSADTVTVWNGSRWAPLTEFTAWDGSIWVRP